MSSAAYFRQKAEQCRRLASAIVTEKDPAIAGLYALSAEFDARAAIFEEAALRRKERCLQLLTGRMASALH